MVNTVYSSEQTFQASYGPVPVVVARTTHFLDSSKMTRAKRTSGYSQKITHIPISYVITSTHPDWDFIYSSSVHPLEFNYHQTEVTNLRAGMIIDWDTGLERAYRTKVEQFNLLMTAFELAEMRNLISSFVVRATNAFRQVLTLGINVTLINNLVVVPTMMSIRDFWASRGDLLQTNQQRLRELTRPTKFRTQSIRRNKRYVQTIRLAAGAGGFQGQNVGFEVLVDLVTNVKIKKTGNGLLRAGTNVNLILLSSLTSGWNIDFQFVWDRIPLSFIIDYFFGIGEVLASDISDICDFYLTACSEQTKVEVETRVVNFRISSYAGLPLAPVTGYMSNASSPFVKRYEFERYAYPLDAQPEVDGIDPVVFNSVGDLAPSQWLNTLLIFINFVMSAVTRR